MSTHHTVVETTHGRLRGATHDGVHVFKGVPYADTTAGANRFRAPQPLQPWAETREALRWGNSSPQVATRSHGDPFYSWYFETQTLGEDCLSLNIFMPALRSGKRPIMVWIHGGGWREGAGSAPGFDGTKLAQAEDVVVITLNHRLTAFGFLDLGRDDDRFADSGNAGLLDIVAALRWVRDNAAALGGDADNVTVFGESGGASKIAALLVMPAAHGLFHKAIMQSSGGGLRLATPDEAALGAKELAHLLGQETLRGEALQALPMQTLIGALAKSPRMYRGTIDGRSFTTHPFWDTAPALSSNIPVMAGFTATEATFHLRDHEATFDITFEDVARRVARFLKVPTERAASILAQYRAAYPDDRPSQILIALATDFAYKRTTIRMASLQSATARAPVYLYEFNRKSPIEGGRYGVPHTSEIPFIFGTAEAAAATIGEGADIAPLTRIMMRTWAAFARTGNPNNSHLPHWPAYKTDARSTMLLSSESRVALDPGGVARAALDEAGYYGYSHSIGTIVRD